MLESISWPEFISTIALLISGYYVIIVVLLYSTEITNIFKQKKLNLTNTNVREKQMDSNESMELMGAVKYTHAQTENVPREEKIEAENLSVATAQEPEEPITVSMTSKEDEALLKSVSTLLEEINTLTEVVAVGSKEECAELFRTLLSNYPDLTRTAHEPEIAAFIYDSCKEHCEFHIELNEVKSWWPRAGSTEVNNQ
jgi:hypothetical protein